MASAPIGSTLRGISPPSTDEYIRALRSIEQEITALQRDMLIAHARFPGHACTMTQLATLVGKTSFQVANNQYGRLGGKLIAALGIPSPKWKVYGIAGFDDDPETGESRACMYPEVKAALQQMGWISGEASNQAPRSSAPQSVAKQEILTADVGMLSINEVITTLQQRGFTKPAQSGLKVIRLDHPGLASPVYVKQSSSIHARLQAPLVLHPQYEAVVLNLISQPGIARGHTRYYHNSNLRGFPKRRNGGASDIAYGVDVGFHSSAALLVLVDQLLGEPRTLVSNTEHFAELAQVLPEDIALTDTERDALIKARVGQSGYRDELLGYWGGCAVTDCCVPMLLRASHIKPWRVASGAERLDPFNGLLLTPNLDLAFDQGLISFDDFGQILLGEDLDPDSARALNITSDLRLRQIDARHREYLAWHRDNLFRK
ncbi:HNH endonuclease [Pseudomonas sp. NPDC047961]